MLRLGALFEPCRRAQRRRDRPDNGSRHVEALGTGSGTACAGAKVGPRPTLQLQAAEERGATTQTDGRRNCALAYGTMKNDERPGVRLPEILMQSISTPGCGKMIGKIC